MLNKIIKQFGKDNYRLHIGCGRVYKEGFINIDIETPSTGKLDLKADARKLPFEKESCSEIQSFHLIEHISHPEVIPMLEHWYDLLKENGKLMLELPDFDKVVEKYKNGDDDMVEHIFGEQNDDYQFHKWGYNFKRLKKELEEIGFTKVTSKKAIDYHTEIEPCFRVEAVKPSNKTIMTKPIFSIIIGAYNQKHVLPLVLEGWEKQNFKKGFEVFLCDDHSNDGTDKWAEEYAKEKLPFKFTYLRVKKRIEPGGLAHNLNQSLPLSKGKYSFFCMGDTIPKEDTLSELYKHVEDNKVLCGVRENINEQKEFQSWDWRMAVPDEFMKHDLIPIGDDSPWTAITGNGLCVPTEALRKIGGWNEDYHGWESDDYDLALRLYEQGLEFFHTPKVVIQHIEHPHQPRAMKNVEIFKKAVLNYKDKVRKNITSISLEFDDFSPSNHGLFYLDQLHEHYPELKISLFSVPLRDLGNGTVDSWENATDFLEEVKSRPWLEILPHGFFHRQNEVAEWTYDQTCLAIKAWETLFTNLGLNWKKVFRAPYWQYGYEALKALKDNDYVVAINPLERARMKLPDGLKVYQHNWGIQFPFPNKTEIKGHGHIQDWNGTGIGENLNNLFELPVDKPWKFVSELEPDIIHLDKNEKET